jgi:hypothetical protein
VARTIVLSFTVWFLLFREVERRCAKLVANDMAKNGWGRPFEDQIRPPDGRKLITLKHAANYIMKLPRAEQMNEKWQVAAECMIMAAEGRGPLMHARIGVMQAP